MNTLFVYSPDTVGFCSDKRTVKKKMKNKIINDLLLRKRK